MRKFWILSAALAALVGCGGRPAPVYTPGALVVKPGRGTLVIAGGALKPTNAVIYTSLRDLVGPGTTVGVLPTASGVPLESGPGTVEDFSANGVKAEVIDVPFDKPLEADNPAKATQIRSHGAIFFTGGDQTRIINAFRPDAGDTIGYTALLEVLAKGGSIGGTSAGAAMMSDPCIRWGTSEEALELGVSTAEDKGVGIGKGMGFFPYGLTDQHFIARGRTGRLIVAMASTGTLRGYGVEENRALVADLATHQLTAIGGPRAIVLIDLSEATHPPDGHRNIRLTLLGDGDTVDGLTGTVTINRTARPMPIDTTTLTGAYDAPVGTIWGRNVLIDSLAHMVTKRVATVTGSDKNFTVTLTCDEATVLQSTGYSMNEGAADVDFSAVNVRMDILRTGAARP